MNYNYHNCTFSALCLNCGAHERALQFSEPLPPRETRLLTALRSHPELMERIHELVELVGEESGQLDVHQMEDLIVERIRSIGHHSLRDWAHHQQEQCVEKAREAQRTHKHSKKNSSGKPRSAP